MRTATAYRQQNPRRPVARAFVPLSTFHMTAGEMRDAGIRCSEEIADHTRYSPPSVGQLRARVGVAVSTRDRERADALAADSAGDAILASSCRRSAGEIDAVLTAWTARWAVFGGRLGPLHPGI